MQHNTDTPHPTVLSVSYDLIQGVAFSWHRSWAHNTASKFVPQVAAPSGDPQPTPHRQKQKEPLSGNWNNFEARITEHSRNVKLSPWRSRLQLRASQNDFFHGSENGLQKP